MANTPTSRLRLVLQDVFSNINLWGTWLNNGALQLIDEAWGLAEVTVNSNQALTPANFTSDNARRLVLILTGAGGFTVTVPAVDKPYFVINRCAADVTVTPLGGTGAVVRAGTSVFWYCDGTDGFVIDTPLNKIKLPTGPVDFNAQRVANIANATQDTDAVPRGQAVGLVKPFADEAEASMLAAAQSEANAEISENNAAGSAVLAQKWAENPEDVPVVPGKYSALHHADKAAASAEEAKLWDPTNYYTKSQIDAQRKQAQWLAAAL
jgi:hypothetical protein